MCFDALDGAANRAEVSRLRIGEYMFLDIDGNKVFTLSFGKGPQTILAHSGWIGNVEDWIATLAPLSETWRTVVYDHRGTGESCVPVEKITPEALGLELINFSAVTIRY